MNKTIISQLKRTLKKYGIRNADTIVNQTIKMNYEKFLDYADPVYVIDRIASCYEDPTALKKLENANREWLAIVIDKGWCKELDTYIKEFGHKLTLAAIYYCIENNTWQTWKGRFSLQSKSNDYWDGLAYISDAAFYLKDSGKFDPNAPELNGIYGKDNTPEETTTAAPAAPEQQQPEQEATVLGDSVAEPLDSVAEPLPIYDRDALILRLRLDHANELRRLEQSHRDREDTIRQHWQKKLDEQHDRLFSLIEKQQEELNRLRKKG